MTDNLAPPESYTEYSETTGRVELMTPLETLEACEGEMCTLMLAGGYTLVGGKKLCSACVQWGKDRAVYEAEGRDGRNWKQDEMMQGDW